ncbi:hypothetical protein [Streptomyces sp. NPDC047130]|uniref:hypothetical protein n=1 Tax=Streptomyces sp. NPDC047130 TaxID=3155261 RepID=UPI0033F92667
MSLDSAGDPLLPSDVFNDPTLQDALAHVAAMASQVSGQVAALGPALLQMSDAVRQITTQIDPAALAQAFQPVLAMAATVQAMDFTHIANHVALFAEAIPRINLSFLDSLFRGLEPWEQLSVETRGDISDVLQDAFQQADSAVLEDNLVLEGPEAAALEEQARLLNEQTASMPWESRRSLFLWFVTGCASIRLFTATLESDAAQETVGSVADVLAIAVTLFAGLGLLWDRKFPRPTDQS